MRLAPERAVSHCLREIIIQNWILLTLAGISKQARAISCLMQVLVKKRRAAGVGCTKGGKIILALVGIPQKLGRAILKRQTNKAI